MIVVVEVVGGIEVLFFFVLSGLVCFGEGWGCKGREGCERCGGAAFYDCRKINSLM